LRHRDVTGAVPQTPLRVRHALLGGTPLLRPSSRKYVPGHSGEAMNERADERAREAIERRKTKAVDVG
jgi:hypothetical protein